MLLNEGKGVNECQSYLGLGQCLYIVIGMGIIEICGNPNYGYQGLLIAI
jgi:hypothetical protein